MQVTPAPAAPGHTALTMLQTDAVAAANNIGMRLQVADALGNLLTTPAQLAASAALQLWIAQETSSNIRVNATLLAEAVALQPGVSAQAALSGEVQPLGLAFVDAPGFQGLQWRLSLVYAGRYALSVQLGGVDVLASPTNVVISEAGLDPAPARLVGTDAPQEHSAVAGGAVSWMMRPTDAFQNALLDRKGSLSVADLPPASVLLTNWAPGLTLSSFSDLANLPDDVGDHGARAHADVSHKRMPVPPGETHAPTLRRHAHRVVPMTRSSQRLHRRPSSRHVFFLLILPGRALCVQRPARGPRRCRARHSKMRPRVHSSTASASM